MQIAFYLLPDPANLDALIEESVPWLMAWCCVLSLLIGIAVAQCAIQWIAGGGKQQDKSIGEGRG